MGFSCFLLIPFNFLFFLPTTVAELSCWQSFTTTSAEFNHISRVDTRLLVLQGPEGRFCGFKGHTGSLGKAIPPTRGQQGTLHFSQYGHSRRFFVPFIIVLTKENI